MLHAFGCSKEDLNQLFFSNESINQVTQMLADDTVCSDAQFQQVFDKVKVSNSSDPFEGISMEDINKMVEIMQAKIITSEVADDMSDE